MLLFVGCSSHENLYYWGDYQTAINDYYAEDSENRQAQIAMLEATIEKANGLGKSVPPGLHAHLGMLYANVRDQHRALQEWEREKQLFPESAPFISFIQQKIKPPVKKSLKKAVSKAAKGSTS